jgi:hypothetical protein
MRGPQPAELRLSEGEQKELEALVRRHSTPQQLARRAQMILAAQITAAQICQLIALACEQPKERPISHWTGRELAEEVMARGIIAHISPRHATRLLKKGICSRI